MALTNTSGTIGDMPAKEAMFRLGEAMVCSMRSCSSPSMLLG